MTSPPANEKFVYSVPVPPLVVGIELTFAFIFFCAFLSIPYSWGLQRTLRSMHNDPLLWLALFTIFGLTIAVLSLLAFPPKSWLTRLEVKEDRMRLVPKLPLRWIGEPTLEIQIDKRCEEILVRRGSVDSIPFGFRVCATMGNGQRRELKFESGARLSKQQAAVLVNGIVDATGLPVRLLQRETNDRGQPRESPWFPDGRFAFLKAFAMIAFGLAPWIGGIVVGLIGAGAAVATVVGVCLWLCQIVSLRLCARFLDGKSRFPMIRSLATVFTFAASYMIAYVLTRFLIHR